MKIGVAIITFVLSTILYAETFHRPYSSPCTEREEVFEFSMAPNIKSLGNDKYEITFAVKKYCDVAVAIIDPDPKKELVPGRGVVVRHLGAGVLGANVPEPFQKNSLKQTIYWDGKDDLGEYVKEPTKMKLRVELGLKPEFERLLGGFSPYNIPGRIKGFAISHEGVFIFSMGRRCKLYIRHFDLSGNYIKSLVPPPANLPEEKLGGMGYIEYEKGKRALHGVNIYETVSDHLRYPVGTLGAHLEEIQAVIVGNRLFFCNTGEYGVPSAIFYMYTDGSTDVTGISDKVFFPRTRGIEHHAPHFCSSPDGKFLYMTGVGSAKTVYFPCVYRIPTEGEMKPEVWVGDPKKPGSDETNFNNPWGIACDTQGRVYVADTHNNRLQIFSPDKKLIKSIRMDKPIYVCVNPRTGAIYVQMDTRIEGRTVRRTVKLQSLDKPDIVAHLDGPYGMMVLDYWSTKPRLWFSNTTPANLGLLGDQIEIGNNVSIWEEDGSAFKKVLDFDQKVREEEGDFHIGRVGGSGLGEKVACDPTRETVLVSNHKLFELKTGRFLGYVKIPAYAYDDMAYDKRGRLHVHLNPGFDVPGVIRVDPSQAKRLDDKKSPYPTWYYPEMPYDYGVEIPGKYSARCTGALPVKDQPGAKYFQDGLGVTMGGDIAEQCNIYYVPKMDDYSVDFMKSVRGALPPGAGGKMPSYEAYLRQIKESEMRGEEVASIPRNPGVDLSGGTIWTFKRTGELWTKYAVIAGGLINGTQIDEDGNLYFVIGLHGRTRCVEGKPFLANCAGHYGKNERSSFLTGTLIKSKGQKLRIVWSNAPIPLEPLPQRPPDLVDARGIEGRKGWIEGAEWIYAGASPIVGGGCSCPTQRLHLDWYKRVYVPEQYRHSIGILDTSGNLIMHLGRYGNFDSGFGAKSKIPVGGDNIAMSAVRFISGTDNYLVFDDGGERIVVLRLNYYASESVSVPAQ